MTVRNSVKIPTIYKKLTYSWFLIALLWGGLLRWMQLYPVEGWSYKFLLHTHSHIALLGWIYMGLFLLLSAAFLHQTKAVAWLFCIKQISLFGMLFSFPVQGYALVSITFSTLFVFGTYGFAWVLFREIRKRPGPVSTLMKWSLIMLILSSVGPYCLGYFMAKDLGHLPWYKNAIYFYLHFLYNGFFFTGLFALLLKRVENRVSSIEVLLLAIGILLSFFLSVLWIQPHPVFYLLGGLGAVFQLWVITRWCLLVNKNCSGNHWIWGSLLGLIVVKCGAQVLSAIPSIAAWAYQTHPFTIIAYIHLIMLGILTPLLFLLLFPDFDWKGWKIILAVVFGLGVLWTEVLLFGQGFWSGLASTLPYYQILLWGYIMIIVSTIGIGANLIFKQE